MPWYEVKRQKVTIGSQQHDLAIVATPQLITGEYTLTNGVVAVDVIPNGMFLTVQLCSMTGPRDEIILAGFDEVPEPNKFLSQLVYAAGGGAYIGVTDSEGKPSIYVEWHEEEPKVDFKIYD